MGETQTIDASLERYQELKNGAIYDHEVKRIVKAPPKDRQPITQENASAMATARWEAYRQASEQGITRATRRDTPVEAYSRIVEHIAGLATTKEDRTAVEAARFISQAIGYMTDRSQAQPQTVNAQVNIYGNDALQAAAVALLEREGLIGELVEGEAREAE